MAAMTPFRIHYSDNTTLDLDAETPAEARKIASARRNGVITKIKVLKESPAATSLAKGADA